MQQDAVAPVIASIAPVVINDRWRYTAGRQRYRRVGRRHFGKQVWR
jgi:hypothetical protein